MAAPTIPGNTTLPVGSVMAVQVYWDTALNAGSGGWAVVTGASGAPDSGATLKTGDIEIGAVELKNGTTDDRAVVDTAGALLCKEMRAGTGTTSNVSGSASSGTILASNSNRLGAAIYNDSTAVLYLLLASGTASTTNYTVQLAPQFYYEVPFSYTGIIVGIWAAANGAARVTEFT